MPEVISIRRARMKATMARRPLIRSANIVKPTEGRSSSSVIIFIDGVRRVDREGERFDIRRGERVGWDGNV